MKPGVQNTRDPAPPHRHKDLSQPTSYCFSNEKLMSLMVSALGVSFTVVTENKNIMICILLLVCDFAQETVSLTGNYSQLKYLVLNILNRRIGGCIV